MKADVSRLINDLHIEARHYYERRQDLIIGKNRHQGSLGDVVTYLSYAPDGLTDRLNRVFYDYLQKSKREGIEIGYCNCLKTISILGSTVGCGLLAKDIFEAVKFAINEQNKSTDHHEDGDQKE